jgi:hypothetical protein
MRSLLNLHKRVVKTCRKEELIDAISTHEGAIK